MSQEKLFTVQDRPARILPGLARDLGSMNMGEDGVTFGGTRLAAEGGEVEFRHDRVLRGPGLQELADSIVVGFKGAANRVTVDELEGLGKSRGFRSFTLTGEQSVGFAERLEEFPPHPALGNCTAFMPAGVRSNCSGASRAWPIASRSTSAGSRRTIERAKLASSS